MGRWHWWLNGFLTVVLLAAGLILPACPPAQRTTTVPAGVPNAGAVEVRWHALSARGQTQYVRLDLPLVVSGGKITVETASQATLQDTSAPALLPATATSTTNPSNGTTGEPALGAGITLEVGMPVERTTTVTTPALREIGVPAGGVSGSVAGTWRGNVELFAAHLVRGPVDGPMVEQLTGQVRQSADAGSFLVPLKKTTTQAGDTFDIAEPTPLYFKVSVPVTAEPGTYVLPVDVALPGKPVEQVGLAVEVADITVPSDPRVLAVATTRVEELGKIYPETWGTITGQYLDRADLDNREAVAQLDALVMAARAQGVALFVEDMIPNTKVDELGQVTLDWDAYDRVMQPYMDGTAFADRIPLPVWLAPVPPRRLRDSTTQLWQYIDLCAKHFAEKKWVGVPAFLHPALGGGEGGGDEHAQGLQPLGSNVAGEKLRAQVGEMMRLHMPRDMLAVAAPGADVPHGQLWTVNDDDPRLPPAGGLANEQSVRAWPWVCVARGNASGAGGIGGEGGSPTGVKGLVWRDAVARADELVATGGPVKRPLLVVDRTKGASGGNAMATLRMVWLGEGFNDAALLGLLERRADANRSGMISEILAGMAGRTGMDENTKGETQNPKPGVEGVTATRGFLYAGWPVDGHIWDQVTPNLQKLILASDPGSRGSIKEDDPVYQAAKLWLVGTRRPVARIAGYGFGLRMGTRGGAILDARLRVLVENPVNATAEMDVRLEHLAGDFAVDPRGLVVSGAGTSAVRGTDAGTGRQRFSMPAASLAELTLPLAGHVADVMENPGTVDVEIGERFNGAVLQLPMKLPVYRMHAVETGPGAPGAPKLDGRDDDWPLDNMTRVFGDMVVGTRYLSRADLLAGNVRADEKAAHVRWTYDETYLYMLAVCPQDAAGGGITEDRNTEWPVVSVTGAGSGGVRWWGSDGLQVELAALPGAVNAGAGGDRVVKIGFKPSGVVLVQTGQVIRDAKGGVSLAWKDAPPPPPAGTAAAGVKYGISLQREGGRVTGYTVEAAIPRMWLDGATTPAATGAAAGLPGAAGGAVTAPAWRINVLRHRAGELVSSSWSGPLVEDDDVAMMGAMIGE